MCGNLSTALRSRWPSQRVAFEAFGRSLYLTRCAEQSEAKVASEQRSEKPLLIPLWSSSCRLRRAYTAPVLGSLKLKALCGHWQYAGYTQSELSTAARRLSIRSWCRRQDSNLRPSVYRAVMAAGPQFPYREPADGGWNAVNLVGQWPFGPPATLPATVGSRIDLIWQFPVWLPQTT